MQNQCGRVQSLINAAGPLNAKLEFALKQCNQQCKYADRFIACAEKLKLSEHTLERSQEHHHEQQSLQLRRSEKTEQRLKRRLERQVAFESSRAAQIQSALELTKEKLPNLHIACGFLERRQEYMYERLLKACDKLRENGHVELADKLEHAPNDEKIFRKFTGQAADDALKVMEEDTRMYVKRCRQRQLSISPERVVKCEASDPPESAPARASFVATKQECV